MGPALHVRGGREEIMGATGDTPGFGPVGPNPSNAINGSKSP